MMKIVVAEKPSMGNIQRTCHACGEPYSGWNFVLCFSCEDSHAFEIVEAWR